MPNPILIDKDGVQREISLPFSIWMTREDVDHIARRIYETLQLWNTYNVDEGWLDIYAIERGRVKSAPIAWTRAANVVPLNDRSQSETADIVEEDKPEVAEQSKQ